MQHRILERFSLPGVHATDHEFELPLDYEQEQRGNLVVFARELVAPTRAQADLPMLVYLQGGPGHASPRPDSPGGWLGRALKDFRVLLLDQRGTGRSSPFSSSRPPAGTAQQQADTLACFRADSIVRDCEAIRGQLLGPDRPWTILGQSFGGFCSVHYLSAHPGGLAGALITGGLPPLEGEADAVYRRTYPTLEAKNVEHFERFSGDRDRLQRILDRIESTDTRLPSGDRLDRDRR